jgi:acetyl esterase/lipase
MTSLPVRRLRNRRFVSLLSALLLALPLAGCGTVKGLLIRTVMDKARLPEGQIERDLAYGPHERNRLDLFRPAASGWPLLVFVHGGSWNAGDKALEVGSFQPYQNIGSYYASRGVGVAVLNYRLQPAVDWRGQVEDVAAAVGWLAGHVAERGGDPRRIFLSGHSAGAQLVSYVAAAPWLAERRGQAKICGVIAVSGAGFDLADQKTYQLGADPKFYERTFRNGRADGVWQKEASVSTYLRPDLPPFLIYYGAKEWPSLRHQNELFARQLRQAGASVELRRIPKLRHSRMALAISDEKRPMAERILSFLGSCPE